MIMAMSMLVMTQGYAQENQLAIDAQLRTRGEYNNGAIKPRAEHELPATFVNERARLSLNWKRDNLELKASVQHTGVWGQDDIKDRNGRVAMNEAWGKMKFSDNYFIQVGRQQLSYDDERLLGGLDWNVAGNWHDAIRMGYGDDNHKLHVALAYNTASENNRGNFYTGAMPYKTLGMAWYHYNSDMLPLGLSLLLLNVGQEAGTAGNGKTKYKQTAGTDITFKPTQWDIHGAFYYQFGKTAADKKVSAWMASAKVGYSFDPLWQVSLGYDYMSGDDGKDADKVKSFDALYGTHHKFLGSMDYFGTIPQQGLQDIQAGVSTKALKNVNMQLNYHYFMLNEKLVSLGKEQDKGLGHELDFQLSAKLMKDVTLMGGYSVMLGTETMDKLKGGHHKSWQDWAWVQLNINPRVLFTKW